MAKRVISIEELRRELAEREAQLAPLEAQREKLARQLADLDDEIAALMGTPATRRGRKPGRKKRGRKAIVRAKGKRGRRGRRKGAVAASVTAAPGEADVPRFTGKGVRSLRKQLKLSQEKFGNLVGVSPQTVYQWETKPGPLNLRKVTQNKLAKVWTTDSQKKQMPAEEAKQEKKPVKKTAKKKAQKKEQPQE